MVETLRVWLRQRLGAVRPVPAIINASIGQGFLMAVGVVGATFLTWWADPNLTRAGVVIFFLGVLLALAIATLLFAMAWRWIFPFKPHTDAVAIAAPSQPQTRTQPSGDTLSATAEVGPALYYSDAEKDRILGAMGRIARLVLQDAVPLREALIAFAWNWKPLFHREGEAGVQSALDQLRADVETTAKAIQAIDIEYADHRDQIRAVISNPIMGGKLFESIDGFKHALKKLPPQLGEGTLDLLQTDHDRLSAARESLQKWIDETERRREEKTRKVRAMRSNPA